MRIAALALLAMCSALCATGAQAAGYRSVGEATILYDAPSLRAGRLFIAPAGMPVQTVVTLEAWVKVRDASGGLAWIERKALDEKPTLVTLVATLVRSAPNDFAASVFQIDRGVLLEPVDADDVLPSGWVKVRHSEGQSGYIKTAEVWGL
jgi:SH3-like domain-containing protein